MALLHNSRLVFYIIHAATHAGGMLSFLMIMPAFLSAQHNATISRKAIIVQSEWPIAREKKMAEYFSSFGPLF